MTADTLQYYPRHLKEIKEFIRLSAALDAKFNEAWAAVEQFGLNMYLNTMDADTCAKWEALLGITYSSTDSLDYRRQRVMAYMASNLPYTEKKIREILASLCGEGCFELTVDASTCSVTFYVTSGSISLAREAYALLRQLVPANMGISSALADETTQAVYVNAAASYYTLAPAIHEATVSESEADSVSYANTAASGYTVSSIYEAVDITNEAAAAVLYGMTAAAVTYAPAVYETT